MSYRGLVVHCKKKAKSPEFIERSRDVADLLRHRPVVPLADVDEMFKTPSTSRIGRYAWR